MAYDIGPKIGIDGEAEFRKAIQQVSENIKTLGTDMNVVVSEFGKGEDSMESLTRQNEILTDSISAQEAKLALLRDGLQKATEKYGDGDVKVEKWKQSVNKATVELNSMKSDLAKNEAAMESFGNETENAGKDLDDAADKALSFGDVLKANVIGDAITSGLKTVAEGIKNIAGALKEGVVESAAYADEILTLSTNTGLSTDTLQELKYMAELTDTSLETMTGSMAKLTRNMATAQGGTGAAAEAFDALGVAITKEDGTLRSNQAVFQDVIGVLSEMENETQRDAYSMQIFGKSAQDLNSFMAQGADGIAALAEEAHNVGYVLDQDTLGSLGSVDDALQRFDGSMTALKNNIISNFAPAISTGIESLTSFLTGETDASQFIETISGIVLQAAEELISGLPAMVEAGGQLLTSLIDGVRTMFPAVLTAAGEVISTLFEGLLSEFPRVLETGAEMLTTLVTGIAESLPELIPAAVSAIMEFVDALTEPDMLGSLIDAALLLTVSLAEGLVKAIPELLQAIPTIIANLVAAIVESLPKLLAAGVQLIVTLGLGLVQAIPELVTNIPVVIAAIVNGVINGISKIRDVGKDIVRGLWNGISDMASWLGNKIKSFCSNALGAIKNFFGINSPSTVMRDQVGKFMAEGIGVGFENEMGSVQSRIDRSMAGLVPNLDTSAGYASAVSGPGASGGYTAADLAAAVKEALNGAAVYMDQRKVGRLITRQQQLDQQAVFA